MPTATTTRVYTARLDPEPEAARKLWNFHVAYSGGLRTLADHLVSLAAHIARPTTATDQLGRLQVVSAWIHPASESDAGGDALLPEGLETALTAHLDEAGITGDERARWLTDASIWFGAPTTEGAVWMNRRARAKRAGMPEMGWGALIDAVAHPDTGGDALLAQVAGNWVSSTIGTGAKRNWEAIAAVALPLAEAVARRIEATEPLIPDILAAEVLGRGLGALDLADALRTRGNAGPTGLLVRVDEAGGSSEPLDDRIAKTFARLVAAKAANAKARVQSDVEIAQLRDGGSPTPADWLWAQVHEATGWSYERVRYVELLTQGLTVARSYRAKQLTRISELLDLHAAATKARVAVPDHVAEILDAYCRQRRDDLGMERPYYIGARASRGYESVVAAWREMDDVSTDERRTAVAHLSRGVGDPHLYAYLARFPQVWADDAPMADDDSAVEDTTGPRPSAKTGLGRYLAWEALAVRAARRKAPKLTLPDPTNAPRFSWWGSSKPSVDLTWDGTMSLALPDGPVVVPWRSGRIRRQLRPRDDSPDATAVTRNDRRSRLASGIGATDPVRVADLLGASAVQLRCERAQVEGAQVTAVDPATLRWSAAVVIKLTPAARAIDDRIGGHRVLGLHFGIRRDASWSVWEMVDDDQVSAVAKAEKVKLPGPESEWWIPGPGPRGYYRVRNADDAGPHFARLAASGTISLTGQGTWARPRTKEAARRLCEMGITVEASWAGRLASEGKVRRTEVFAAALAVVRRGVAAQRALGRVVRGLTSPTPEDTDGVLAAWQQINAWWPVQAIAVEDPLPLEQEGARTDLAELLTHEWRVRQGSLLRALRHLRAIVFDGVRNDGPSMQRVEELTGYVGVAAAMGSLTLDLAPASSRPPIAAPIMAYRLRVRREWARVLAGRVVDVALENGCSDVVVEDLAQLQPSRSRSVPSNRRLSQWAIQDMETVLSQLCTLHGLRMRLVSPRWNSRVDSLNGEMVLRWREVPITEAHRVLAARWWHRAAVWAERSNAADHELTVARRAATRRVNNLLQAVGDGSGAGRGVSIMVPDDQGNRVAPAGAEIIVHKSGGWTVVGSTDCDLNAAINVGRMGCVRRKLRKIAESPD